MTKNLKILIAEPDGYSPKAIVAYKKLGSVLAIKPSQNGFEKALSKTDVLVVRLGVPVKKEILSKAKNLKAIATNTTGLNHIDLTETVRRSIAVISLRGHTAFLEKIHATPELTWGLLLALVRKLPWAFASVKQGRWDRDHFAGHELQGKTLGILGLGRIGRIIANYGRVFRMTVLACDPNISTAAMKKLGVKKVTMDQLFRRADVLSVHVLHTVAVNQLVQARHFRLMKPTAYFINTARGELTDEAGLLKALKEKWIAGAALDVMGNEDSKGGHLKTNPLINYVQQHDNLLITPHIGGAAIEAWQATEEFLAELVIKHFR